METARSTTVTVGISAYGGWNWDRQGHGWNTVVGTDEQVAAFIETHDHLAYDLGTDEEYGYVLDHCPAICKALRIGAFQEQCEHGLAAWLCADPFSHYPRDL